MAMRAIEAGRQSVRTVTVGTPLNEVAQLMAAEGLRALVVTTDDGRPTGIVSERDLVVRGLAWNLPPDTPVEAVMTPDLVSADPSAPTRSVYRLLVASGLRQVPLVESGRVVGIVGRADLVDEETAEVMGRLGGCPHCGGGWLRPVSTADATNFVCLQCRGCWRIEGGVFVAVEQRSCPGCPDHNFCRFPLIDYGVDISRLPPPEERSGPDVLGVEARTLGR
jgi:CBS domain-containing protein